MIFSSDELRKAARVIEFVNDIEGVKEVDDKTLTALMQAMEISLMLMRGKKGDEIRENNRRH